MRLLILCAVVLIAVNAAQYPEYKGKSVLVTGGCQGIGYATALKFAEQGALVTIVCRNETKGKRAEIRQQKGQAYYVAGDLTKADVAERVVAMAVQRFKSLDIAVNGAGISGYMGYMGTFPAEIMESIHDTMHNNWYATFNALNAEVRHFRKQMHDACVVNIASANGRSGTPIGSLYGSSKWAIIGLTKSVALEYIVRKEDDGIPFIRVNALAPGLVNTPFTWNQAWYMLKGVQPYEGDYDIMDDQDPNWLQIKDAWISQLPGQRISAPEEQADAILNLCSDRASYVSGSVYDADLGGAAHHG
ncbi:hypothetical protein GEMRC1_007845 [Eukaryota sp. GEM-RC1]